MRQPGRELVYGPLGGYICLERTSLALSAAARRLLARPALPFVPDALACLLGETETRHGRARHQALYQAGLDLVMVGMG